MKNKENYINTISKMAKQQINDFFTNIKEALDPERNSTTVAHNPREVLVWKCLDLRDALLYEFSLYYEYTGGGSQYTTHKIRAKLKTLFSFLYSQLKRTLSKEEFEAMKKGVDSLEFGLLESTFYELSEWLDKKQITKIDTKSHSTSPFAEGRNRHNGYN